MVGKYKIFLTFVLLKIFLNCLICQEIENLEHEMKYFPWDGKKDNEIKEDCIIIDESCVQIHEIASYEAIKLMHAQLDDDESGDIDLSESVDFLREELNYTKGIEKRQEAFHHNNDKRISVKDLWNIWLTNEVHNWTVEQTVNWLESSVELSQYADVFIANAINGSVLPRLATNSEQYLTRILGIKSGTHRSKICVKSMDIVLFGPPKETDSRLKDTCICVLMIVIVVLLVRFHFMSRSNNMLVDRMGQDIETLKKELLKFNDLKSSPENLSRKNSRIEDQKSRRTFSNANREEDKNKDLIEEEDEFRSVKEETQWQNDLSENSLTPDSEIPPHHSPLDPDLSPLDLDISAKNELQLWLQLTYEKERQCLECKVREVKRQLEDASALYDKIKPNRKNLFGAFSFMHGKMEYKGFHVMEARTALSEIQLMDREMELRWGTIERLMTCTITQNTGLDHLQFILEPSLQHAMPLSSANSAVGLTNADRVDTPSYSYGRQGPTDVRKRIPHSHTFADGVSETSSVVSYPVRTSNFSNNVEKNFRPKSLLVQNNTMFHSHTVGSGLSTLEKDSRYPGLLTLEKDSRNLGRVYNNDQSKAKVLNLKNSKTVPVKQSSIDDTDSGNFTVGDSEIQIGTATNTAANTTENSTTESMQSFSLVKNNENAEMLDDVICAQMINGSHSSYNNSTLAQETLEKHSNSEPNLELDNSSLVSEKSKKKTFLRKAKLFVKFKNKLDKKT